MKKMASEYIDKAKENPEKKGMDVDT